MGEGGCGQREGAGVEGGRQREGHGEAAAAKDAA
jgi:hypothetical protein